MGTQDLVVLLSARAQLDYCLHRGLQRTTPTPTKKAQGPSHTGSETAAGGAPGEPSGAHDSVLQSGEHAA